MTWWKGTPQPEDDFLTRLASEFSKIEDLIGKIPNDSTFDDENGEIQKKSKIAEGLIKHYLDLSKVLDQRRGDYYKAALQLVAIGLTGLGLLLKFINLSPISLITLAGLSICLGLMIMIITSFLVIRRFYWQTKSDRYHFLKIDSNCISTLGNSWMWFYHGVEGLSKIPFTSVGKNEKEKLIQNKNGVEGYVDGARFFFDKFIAATPRDIYIQNLKHAYLLLVHNAYKNRFERQLTDLLSKGINIASYVVMIALLMSFTATMFTKVPITSKPEAIIVNPLDTSSLKTSVRNSTSISPSSLNNLQTNNLSIIPKDTSNKKESKKKKNANNSIN